MASMDLRPLTLGELLDRSFSLYRTHFRTFVAIMAPPAVLAAAFGLLVELLPTLKPPPEALSPNDIVPVLLIGGAIIVGSFVFVVVYIVAYMVALGATTSAVSELYLGRPATAAAAYGRVRGRIGRLVLLMLLIWLRIAGIGIGGVVLGMLAAALGRVIGPLFAGAFMILMFLATGFLILFMSLRYALAVAAVVLEPITARQAIRRSIALTSGNLLRVLVLVIFATIITYITTLLFQGPFMIGAVMAGPDTRPALWLNLLGAFTGAVAGAISGPLMIIALALLYYDARIRHEGLDLQLMLQTLDVARSAPVAPRPPAVLPG